MIDYNLTVLSKFSIDRLQPYNDTEPRDEMSEKVISAEDAKNIINKFNDEDDGITVIESQQLLIYLLKELNNLAEINKVLVEALEKIGHRNEPDHLDASQTFGYMYCCEDVIKDANEALAKAKEMGK